MGDPRGRARDLGGGGVGEVGGGMPGGDPCGLGQDQPPLPPGSSRGRAGHGRPAVPAPRACHRGPGWPLGRPRHHPSPTSRHRGRLATAAHPPRTGRGSQPTVRPRPAATPPPSRPSMVCPGHRWVGRAPRESVRGWRTRWCPPGSRGSSRYPRRLAEQSAPTGPRVRGTSDLDPGRRALTQRVDRSLSAPQQLLDGSGLARDDIAGEERSKCACGALGMLAVGRARHGRHESPPGSSVRSCAGEAVAMPTTGNTPDAGPDSPSPAAPTPETNPPGQIGPSGGTYRTRRAADLHRETGTLGRGDATINGCLPGSLAGLPTEFRWGRADWGRWANEPVVTWSGVQGGQVIAAAPRRSMRRAESRRRLWRRTWDSAIRAVSRSSSSTRPS